MVNQLRELRTKTNCLLLIIMSMILAGCGGGSDDGNSSQDSVLQGNFIDSPVSGVTYQTITQSGVTDTSGIYQYLTDEQITFSIGDITIGQATGNQVLTPVNFVANATSHTNTQVLKILQLLQSLDSDLNPNNGIQILESVRIAASGQQINFSSDSEATIGQIVKLISGDNRSLLSAIKVSNHFSQAMTNAYAGTYTGTWIDNSESGTFSFTLGTDGAISQGLWQTDLRQCAISGRIATNGTVNWSDCDNDAGSFVISLTGMINCSECLFITRTISGQRQGNVNLTVTSTPECKARPHSLLPPLTGDFCIGSREVRVTDTSRAKTFTEETDNQRDLMLRIWYPTDTTTGTFSKYMDSSSYSWMIKTFQMPSSFTLPTDADDQIKPHSIINAPLATSQQTFPVLLFSPGLKYVTATYTAFLEQLASHGYIIVAINHSYVSGVTVLPGQATPIEISEKLTFAAELNDTQFGVVVDDTKFVLNQISNPSGDLSFLANRLDLAKVGMLGHSLGGSIAMQMCEGNTTIVKACANMDGVPRGTVTTNGTSKPLLLSRSVVVLNDAKFTNLFSVLTGDAYSLRIAGVGHSNFSDGPLMIQHFIPSALTNEFLSRVTNTLIGIGNKDPVVAIDIVNQMHLHFFNHYLRGESKSIFLQVPTGFFKDPFNTAWFPTLTEKIFTVK